MSWKKFGRALLYPHIAVLILLLPAAACALVYGMVFLAESDPIRIGAYVLSFYTLTIWCARIPQIIGSCVNFRNENKFIKRWLGDVRLRINVTLMGNILWNGAYAAFQLGLGIYHRSAWFCSLAGYYASLAVMRFFLVRYTVRHSPGEKMGEELRRYRICGWIFLFMNLALSVMIFYMIHENRIVKHHEITTITMAAYTFTSLTMAIINVVKYRRYNSPVFSASKAISLAAGCVSMLTLEGTMLTTFGREDMTPQTQVLFLALSGGAVTVLIVSMAVYMLVGSDRKIKCMETENGTQ